ncbi:MAG: EutP/PduV family microcompartment system protein [Clostridium sp.]|uniref:EutP/PduV family microcompartment system protein n=1 Tax=Clostridium sp. TaxID=1506 RepID=UPI0030615D12
MKKVIFIGKTGSGKTTLCQKLNNYEVEYKKTQSVEIYDESIDTPGEYLENRFYYKALIVTAADANIIGLVYDCTSEESYIAPGFASMFSKDTIGIITKIDMALNSDEIQRARERLQEAGVSTIFEVNTLDGTGIAELDKYLSS